MLAQQQQCAVCMEERSLDTFTQTCSTHAAEVCETCLAHPLMGYRCPICRGTLVLSAATKRSRSEEERAEKRTVRRRLRDDASEARRLFREINEEFIIEFVADEDDDNNNDDEDDTSSVSVDPDSTTSADARELEVYADV